MRADDTADLVLMRAAEMYLIEAEANVRDGMKLSQAVIPLITLRNARGVVDYDVAGKITEDVINEILHDVVENFGEKALGLRTYSALRKL